MYLYDIDDAEFKYKCTTAIDTHCQATSVSFSKILSLLVDISDDGTVEMLVS